MYNNRNWENSYKKQVIHVHDFFIVWQILYAVAMQDEVWKEIQQDKWNDKLQGLCQGYVIWNNLWHDMGIFFYKPRNMKWHSKTTPYHLTDNTMYSMTLYMKWK